MDRLCFDPEIRSESSRSPGMYVPAIPTPSSAWKKSALANPLASQPNPALEAAATRLPTA